MPDKEDSANIAVVCTMKSLDKVIFGSTQSLTTTEIAVYNHTMDCGGPVGNEDF